MTQKSGLFKGQQKKSSAANRHGKLPHIRKGRVFKASLKKNKDLEASEEVGKFINAANEMKAAAQACKEGARLHLVNTPAGSTATLSSKESKSVIGKKKK